MKTILKTSITLATAAAAFAVGAEPLQFIDTGEVRGVLAPERLNDGSINHQVDPDNPFILSDIADMPDDLTPVIVAGDPLGTPSDSPTNRINPNSPVSAYAGTAHIFIGNSFVCTATPISDRYLISANHCVDVDDDGDNDFGTNIRVTFNVSGDNSTVIFPSGVAAVYTHPDYTGFNNPNVSDDIIIIELVNDLPADIPRYEIFRGSLNPNAILHLVGYGTTGDAVNGYIPGSASFNIKRVGQNRPDRGFFADDEGSGIAEIFQYDFDHWQGNSLGNDIETTVGGGDSGGPAYIQVGNDLQLYGVNTYTGGGAPGFGSMGGGMLINGYLDFIDSIVDPVPGSFLLNLPICGDDNQSPATFLDWDPSALADSYTITVATDVALNNVVYTESGVTDSHGIVPGGALSGCTSYFWSVTAFNANGETIAQNAVCSFSTSIAGDLNGDGVVDAADLGGLIGVFGSAGPFADINADGIVDAADLGILISAFGTGCN